jgi:hypothetical protein
LQKQLSCRGIFGIGFAIVIVQKWPLSNLRDAEGGVTPNRGTVKL